MSEGALSALETGSGFACGGTGGATLRLGDRLKSLVQREFCGVS